MRLAFVHALRVHMHGTLLQSRPSGYHLKAPEGVSFVRAFGAVRGPSKGEFKGIVLDAARMRTYSSEDDLCPAVHQVRSLGGSFYMQQDRLVRVAYMLTTRCT